MVIEIPLTQNKTAVIDDIDSDLLQFKWHVRRSYDRYYATRNYNVWDANGNKKMITIKLHIVILERKLGRALGEYEWCDHVDNDPLNNTRANLRPASPSQNVMNSKLRSDNKSGCKGVSWHKNNNKWVVHININGKKKSLGYFTDLAEAIQCRKDAVNMHYGEFRRD